MTLPREWPGRPAAIAIATAIMLCDKPSQMNIDFYEAVRRDVADYLRRSKPYQKRQYEMLINTARQFGIGD